jgi:hypothetical protein
MQILIYRLKIEAIFEQYDVQNKNLKQVGSNF